MTPIVTNTRTEFWANALADYREIEADPWASASLRARAREQREQLENESPLLEWEGES